MTTIRSMCPRCGPVDMDPEKVRLYRRELRSEYTFVCPVCGDFVVKAADARIIGLLSGAGVQDGSKRPEEILNPDAPPLTIDDLIDFHQELEDL
jgi:rRNA maturation protein Nop10